MEQRCLIDTSILIQAQKGDTHISKRLVTLKNPTISVVTACELLIGSSNKRQLAENKAVMRGFTIVNINQEISTTALKLTEDYTLRTGFGVADALIAATAVRGNFLLWTLNKKHFNLIEGIQFY